MAPLPSVLLGCEMITRFDTGSDLDVINRYFFSTLESSSPTNADWNSWCNSVATDWNSLMAPQYPTDVTLVEVTARDLTSATSGVGIANVSHAGTRTGTMLPAGAAVVVGHQIARRYRGGKPRSYLNAGVTGDLATPQTWTAGFTTSLLTQYNLWLAAIEAITVGAINSSQYINISYYHGFTNFTYPSGRIKAIPTPRTTPLQDPIVSNKINPNVASQRRRNKTP